MIGYMSNVSWFSSPAVERNPDNRVHVANMGPIWGQQGPGGPHVGPIKFVIWEGMDGQSHHLVLAEYDYLSIT